MTLTRTLRDSKTQVGAGGGITSNTFTPSNNSLLVVFASLQQDTSSPELANLSITDSLGTHLGWVKQQDRKGAGDYYSPLGVIWTAPVATGVPMTVTVSHGGFNTVARIITIVDYTGYDTTTPVGVYANEVIADDGAANVTLSGVPLSTSEIFGGRAAGVGDTGSSAAVPNAFCTELYDLSCADGQGLQVQVRPAGSISTTDFGWSDTANGTSGAYDSFGLAIEIKSADSGATAITGTPSTVASVAGTGTISATTAVTGTSATVASVCGTGTIGGASTDITGTSTKVEVNVRVGQIDVASPDPAWVADRGKRTSVSTGNGTITITNPTTIVVGNYLIARVAVDNSGASGARPGLTFSDTRNGTWAHGTGALQDPGATSAGIAVYLCYVEVTTPYQAGDVFSFAWATGTPICAIVVEEWKNVDQTTPLAVAEVQGNNVSSTAQPSVSRTPLAVGQLVYVAAGLEGFSSYWGAQDTDTTGGSWGDVSKDEGNTGTAATSVSVYGGYKVVTSTAAQTWNNTIGTTSDWAACAVVFAKQILTSKIMGIPTEVNTTAGVGVITIPTPITGTSSTVASFAGTGTVTGNADVAGTSATVASIAGTGTISATTAITGTSATVASVAGTGVITSTVAITGTPATVASFAGTGVITSTLTITGTPATVASFAGTGTISATTAISGTSATVASFAGTGTISATTAISGTGTTVASFAGTGTVTGNAAVAGTSATVASFAGTGTIGATTAITGTSATVASFAGTGTISTNIIGTSATVASFAGTGTITGHATVTGISATVTVTAGTGTIIVGSDVVGSPATVYIFAGTGIIGATTAITGTSTTVNTVAGTGAIGVTTSINGTSSTVLSFAGTGAITGRASVTGTSSTVLSFAGTGAVTGRASLTGTSATVISVTGIGTISATTAISGSSAIVSIISGIGQITAVGSYIRPVRQGAILVI